jgi:hypothetical protein
MTAHCKYGNHTVNMHPQTLYIYTDKENGIAENTPTCPACYLTHLQKFYPNSALTKALTEEAKQYPEKWSN